MRHECKGREGVPPLWPWLLVCAVAALWIDLGTIHRHHSADSLVEILVSLFHWTPYYWDQDRIGMAVPLIALPFRDPLLNLLVQEFLHLFAGLAALFLLARYLLRDATYPLVGAVSAAAFLGLAPAAYCFEYFLHYGVWLALGLASLVVAAPADGRRLTVRRGGLALALMALAHWCYVTAGLVLGPLVVFRYLFGRKNCAGGHALQRQAVAQCGNGARLDPARRRVRLRGRRHVAGPADRCGAGYRSRRRPGFDVAPWRGCPGGQHLGRPRARLLAVGPARDRMRRPGVASRPGPCGQTLPRGGRAAGRRAVECPLPVYAPLAPYERRRLPLRHSCGHPWPDGRGRARRRPARRHPGSPATKLLGGPGRASGAGGGYLQLRPAIPGAGPRRPGPDDGGVHGGFAGVPRHAPCGRLLGRVAGGFPRQHDPAGAGRRTDALGHHRPQRPTASAWQQVPAAEMRVAVPVGDAEAGHWLRHYRLPPLELVEKRASVWIYRPRGAAVALGNGW